MLPASGIHPNAIHSMPDPPLPQRLIDAAEKGEDVYRIQDSFYAMTPAGETLIRECFAENLWGRGPCPSDDLYQREADRLGITRAQAKRRVLAQAMGGQANEKKLDETESIVTQRVTALRGTFLTARTPISC